jgi:hypothetical protein
VDVLIHSTKIGPIVGESQNDLQAQRAGTINGIVQLIHGSVIVCGAVGGRIKVLKVNSCQREEREREREKVKKGIEF